MAGIAVTLENRAINDRLFVVRFHPTLPVTDARSLLTTILSLITFQLEQIRGVLKLQLRLRINFYKATDETAVIDAFFISTPTPVYGNTGLEDVITSGIQKIEESLDRFLRMGSGWVINKITYADLYIYKYFPFAAASFLPLPRQLSLKKGILNIQNSDERCFMYSILAYLHPMPHGTHANRVSHYHQYESELNLSGISFPVTLKDIDRFEHQNPFAVNVFGYGNQLYPIRVSSSPNPVVNLLFLKGADGSTHYCLIKDLNRLLYQYNRHRERKHFCTRCLCGFWSEERLRQHQVYCTSGLQRIEMPEDNQMMFRNFKNAMRSPLVIYADIECFTQTIDTAKDNPLKSSSTKVQLHTPNSFAALSVFNCCGKQTEGDLFMYRGENSVTRFLNYVVEQGIRYQCEYDYKQPMQISFEQRVEYEHATQCHICEQPITAVKVRDHCHLCGQYRGPAHSECNIQYWLTRNVVVIFHNLKRYDGHLIMQTIGEIAVQHGLQVNCIPKSTEDYITFTLAGKHTHSNALGADGNPKIVSWRMKFIDSFQFLPTSLANLTDNLIKSGKERFHQMKRHFNEEQLKLVLRKNIYPYDKVTDWSAFNVTELFSKEEFFNHMTMEAASPEDWQHALAVWKQFNMRRFGEYHDLYLKVDVLLLADIFENFRLFCLANYRLDPAHYVSLPSFGWDTMLRMTGVKLELLTDPDMYTMFESGIRGGISQISKRYAAANNKYVPNFDSSQDSTYLLYLDMNNLYGVPMSQACLPISHFEWARPSIDFMSLPDDGSRGCILEVDLDYPDELHESHNDYPLAPETKTIEDPSPYSLMLADQMKIKPVPTPKLIPNFDPKERYVVHYRNLKFYINHGLKLTKVHRVLKFRQSPWMKPYIEFNTDQRKKCKSDFEKDLFKLLNNAVFGKSMENVRNRILLKLVTDETKFNEIVGSPLFKECFIFSEQLVGLSMAREAVQLNKPIYAGFSILDLSKLTMYQFHYDYMIPKFGNKCNVMFTDTDSLLYLIKTEDVYQDLAPDVEKHFDTSDYPSNHIMFNPKNKKIPGFMHDEMSGRIVQEFVGLRSKMYSILCDSQEKKRAKGVKKTVIKKCITHEDYKNALQKGTLLRHEMRFFRSEGHQIFTIDQNKISLSAYDDKRFICDNGIDTLAFGHNKIK